MAKIDPLRKKLESEYRKLAKRADQRLVRLEGYAHDKGFKGIKEFAYKVAMRDIASYSGKGAKRFNTKPPKDIRKLQNKIADIKKFLASPTSTKKGVIEVHKRRAEALNNSEKLFGTGNKGNFTWQEWANFWEKVGNDYLDRNLDYRAGAKILAMEKKMKITDRNFDKKMNELVRNGDIDIIEREQFERLQELGISYKDLK